VGTLLTAGGIAYGVYQAEKRREIALLVGLAFLASNYIYHIGPLLRQHYFMVMFETWAVVILAGAFHSQAAQTQTRRVWFGLGLLFLAGYTKQLAAYTAAAIFAWMALRNPRRTLNYLLVFAALGGGVFIALNVLTGGAWWVNTVSANVNLYIFSQFTGLLRQFISLHWALLILAALVVLYELYFSRISLYSLWFVVAFASTFGAGKWGAGDSYFATAIAAACLLAGIFISRTVNGAWHFPENYLSRAWRGIKLPAQARPLASLACLALVLIYGLSVMKMPTSGPIFEPLSQALGLAPNPGHRYPFYDSADWTAGYATIGHLPSQEDHAAGWLIVERIRAVPGPVISEEAGFMLQAGREVIGNPTQLKNLAENDLMDTSALVADIEAQKFGLVIFRARFYPDSVLAAIDDAYAPQEVIRMNGFDYELWYPESTWPLRQQIRNYLEGLPTPAAGPDGLQVDLPGEVAEPDEWIKAMLARWAWVLEKQESAGDCQTYHFARRGEAAQLEHCGQGLRIWLESTNSGR
jgi:hypothetical protein